MQVEVKESSVLSGPNYVELSSLSPNIRYDIWVKAATGAGYGASSIITSIILGRIGTRAINLMKQTYSYTERERERERESRRQKKLEKRQNRPLQLLSKVSFGPEGEGPFVTLHNIISDMYEYPDVLDLSHAGHPKENPPERPFFFWGLHVGGCIIPLPSRLRPSEWRRHISIVGGGCAHTNSLSHTLCFPFQFEPA